MSGEKRIDVKRILATPPRPLSEREKAKRSSFEGFAGKDAVPVESAHNYGAPRG
jgi:hypothetical protein